VGPVNLPDPIARAEPALNTDEVHYFGFPVASGRRQGPCPLRICPASMTCMRLRLMRRSQRLIKPAAAKIGANVETEPSINPRRPAGSPGAPWHCDDSPPALDFPESSGAYDNGEH
jgi:hypothetical protein